MLSVVLGKDHFLRLAAWMTIVSLSFFILCRLFLAIILQYALSLWAYSSAFRIRQKQLLSQSLQKITVEH